MKALFFTLLLLTGVSWLMPLFGQAKPDAILGEWLSPKKDARMHIYRQGNQYAGKVLWGTGSDPKDSENPNPALRQRALIGLNILNNFVFDGDNTWTDGTIYDPREGKTYSCKLTLKTPNQLNIRGYVGVSLFWPNRNLDAG